MIQKLLFIDSSVPEKDVLISNINTEQVKIVKDNDSLADVNLEGITHIAFAWKNYWIGTIKPRFPLFSFSLNNDNNNLYQQKTIKEIAGNFPKLENIDLITCNLNENGEWKDAFDELKDGLSENINVRYSINRTGSATLQGDWILESHSVNILDEYFANKDFVYNHHLDTDPFQTVSNLEEQTAFMRNGTILELTSDFTITNVDDYDNGTGNGWIACEILDTDDIDCIDGKGHTLTFENATVSIESIFFNGTGEELVIKNLIVDGDASYSFKGIVYSEYDCPAQQVVVKNCGVENLQINNGYGAIFGKGTVYAQGSAYAIACYSTGNISNCSGGIYGEFAGSSNSSAYAIACYSTGDISDNSGGIYGKNAGLASSSVYAIACYSTGDITTNSGNENGCGGIYGSYAGIFGGAAYSIACYSIGDITTNSGTNNGSGGIYGSYAGRGGLAYAIACYSTGDITTNSGTNNGSGGIYGSYAGNPGSAYAIACYSTGDITTNSGNENGCGGIYGSNSGNNVITAYAIECYSTGDITTNGGTNNGCGGIYGSNAGFAYAIACYSTGHKDVMDISGYLFGTNGNIIAVETFAITNMDWEEYDPSSGTGTSETYDPIDNTNTPDPKLFKYDTSKTIKNQLELRFFRSLPWDPRSPIPQRPFLLDWSTCDFDKVFYDKWFDTNDAWYINNDFNFDNPITLENVKDLLTNLNNPSLSLDDYEPNDYVDCIKLEPIDISDIQLCDMVLVYNSGITTIIRVTEITENWINGTYNKNSNTFYRINTKYPIYSEFINNENIDVPFELNFICVEDYDIAEANWRGFNLCKPVIKPNYNCCIPIKNKCNHILGMDYLTQFLI
jgi:hypothetical protein